LIPFRLPLYDSKLLGKWLKTLKINNLTPPSKYFDICSKHFREDDYRKTSSGVMIDTLHDSVPSISPDCLKRRRHFLKNK